MARKDELYRKLKDRGVVFDVAYASLTVEDLEAKEAELLLEDAAEEVKAMHEGSTEEPAENLEIANLSGLPDSDTETTEAAPVYAPAENSRESGQPVAASTRPGTYVPAAARIPTQGAYQPTLNTWDELRAHIVELFESKRLVEGMRIFFKGVAIPVTATPETRAGMHYGRPEDLPIRIDLTGKAWYLDEVRKPNIPTARMTRKVRYMASDTIEQVDQTSDGYINEIYEVPGTTQSEVTSTVTLPSWQSGRYRDPRLPFAVHVYNDRVGFDYLEVIRFFGGAEMIPKSVKKLYVGTLLTYHIPSVREAIENRYNRLSKGMLV